MTTWVIGGTSGIGRAVAERLEGHVVVSGENTDVRNTDLLRASVPPNLNRVIYCAGVNYLEWLGDLDRVETRRVLDTNLYGFISLMDVLASRGDPLSVVAVSSDAAERPMRTSISYCASKAGLNMAIRCAARELGPQGWRVNGVAPGMTDATLMTEYVDQRVPDVRGWSANEALKYEEQQAVIKRRATPEECAQMIMSILSGPDYLNGEIITMNGGR